RNQFCLFLKPWITSPTANLRAVLELVINKIESYELSINDVVVLSGPFLAKHRVMAAHYGKLNLLARDASRMCESTQLKFLETFGVDVPKCAVLGGFEFIER